MEIKLNCSWTEKMKITAQTAQHSVEMDAKSPIGTDAAMTPKELVIAGLCGCTGMDVLALMKKHKQPLEKFEVNAVAPMTEGSYPSIYKEIHLIFKATGAVDSAKLIEAVQLSQTLYCGVSKVLAFSTPINYTIELNGEKIAEGQSHFK